MNPKEPNDDQASQPQEPKQSPITPEAFERRPPVYDPTGKIEQVNSDETIIADVRQHWFGLLFIYVQVFAGLILSLGLIIFLLPDVLKSLSLDSGGATALVALFALIALSLGFVFLVLATRIYHAHQLIITDVNITQVLQIGLFNRKVSELSMSNVEDVTAQQKGIFPTLFKYGTLRIETAGEQNNFLFVYCPNPSAYAKAILDARSSFLSHSSLDV